MPRALPLRLTTILFLSALAGPYGLAQTLLQPHEAQATLTDEAVLALYDGLRVADVSDGLDMVGLRDAGLMDQRIEALWRDIETLGHQAVGIAVTARYVPTNRPVPAALDPEAFHAWEGDWYGRYSSEPFVDSLQPGSVLVLDVSGDGDTGSVGSFNSLAWVERGARAIVTNGGIRDTDEIIKQRIPVYLDHANRGRGIRPGRNEIESVQQPIEVGGVLVRPGDVVVVDGDGVVVVPREYAEPVALAARGILDADKAGRRALSERLGLPLDETVE